MNTNSNVYTVIYTTVVCVLVAAVLAFVSQTLKPRQEANEKAETISQILTAAQFGEKSSWTDNNATINFYKENIASAAVIGSNGYASAELNSADAEIYTVSKLKAQNYNIKGGSEVQLPVYIFKNGVTVLPIYGAGLWGPVWGYIALSSDLETIVGAYFDHESETPGLGGKIKDDPAFRGQFPGKKVLYGNGKAFNIVKGGANGMANGIDAITGATMTSNGVDEAINNWLEAYKPYVLAQKAVTREPAQDGIMLLSEETVNE
ncbi:MAG: NADH:ubiquinone reductase (Na(+)-transporting) subunit C [Bacteroidales bacterium]|nr:NADH:ubiquinone reductase (Na(+)-transporting) subunit C [Bacteroidales bacterium]